ncbi:MAG: anthranilate synthase component I family protein [Thermodesulfobacteriota bacterium]
MLTSPTAVLIDSDCGWVNSGTPSVKIFKSPSFSISSRNGTIYYKSPDSEKKYKGDPIEELERFLVKGFISVGYISYEYSQYTNSRFKIKRNKEGFNSYDTYFHFFNEDEIESCNYEDISEKIAIKKGSGSGEDSNHTSNFSRSEYINIIEKAKLYISSGDIYQVNLSQKFSTSSINNIYSTLVNFYEAQPVPFSALIKFDDHILISGSMELFLRKNGDKIVTKPIKGTAKRSKDKIGDKKIKEQLRGSIKEIAENLMIVDLMRNDLGRICKTGSLKVNELFRINEYRTLFQMESEIEGVLNHNIKLPEIIYSTFPPGSVTGAPKSRALEIIDELEPHYRGPYCGAFGIFYPDMDFTLSVAIRIMLSAENKTCYWVGGGIVWDSEPEKEYEETFLKAKAIRKALS